MSAGMPTLFVRMLRYRVAAMIWLFLLLAATHHGTTVRLDGRFVAAVLALAFGYVAATTLNDLADEEIDKVNHPGDRGRPLATGDASRRDLYVLHVLAVGAAIGAATVLGPHGVAVVAVSLVIGHTYSARPVRLSYRTHLAPAVLAVAYVLVPYGLGVVLVGGAVGPSDLTFGGALYALFLARIVLKDFRDREGDRRHGRPTLLLRHGKDVTCAASLAALTVGGALLVVAVRPAPLLAVVMCGFLAAVASQLHALWRADDRRDEQVAIGIGAKMGNGLLVTVLGVLILRTQGATAVEEALLAVTVAAVYGISFRMLVAHPQRALIAYKG